MILLAKDWDKYPEAIVHIQTKNKSFLEHHVLLKKMGIKNNVFMLALHDRTLINVNPHSENLTREQKVRIAKEIQVNPWYYFREVVVAPSTAGEKRNPFKANRFNIALIWMFFLHITILGIAPRQTGKSFTVDVLMVGITHFWTSNSVIGLVTKDIKLRVSNIERIKAIAAELPPYLRLITRKDSDNSEGITVGLMGNKYITAIGRSGEVPARSVLRGQTLPIIHFDEIAFITNIHITLPAVLGASGAAMDAAKSSGTPYGVIYTTTAGRKDTKSGKYVWDMYINGMVWTEDLLDVEDEKKLYTILDKSSKGSSNLIILDMNHRQLGFTDSWLASKIKAANATGIDAETDFLNRWSDGTMSSPLSQHILDTIVSSVEEPNHTTVSEEGYVLRWYISEERRALYRTRKYCVLGLDTSDAVGKDGIGLTIRDVATGDLIAAGSFNETNLSLFSSFIFDVLQEYTKCTMIIERKSSGMAIVDAITLMMLKVGMDPFKRMFNWTVDDSMKSPERYSTINRPLNQRGTGVYDKLKQTFGFGTTGGTGRSSRDKLYNIGLLGSSKYTGSTTKDLQLVNEIKDLSVKNGRIDHKADGHDDLVISHMLTWWFLTTANNVEFYGIPNTLPLSDVRSYVEVKDAKKKTKDEQEHEARVRKDINDLMFKLESESDPIMKKMLKIKLEFIRRKIDVNLANSLNIRTRLEKVA